jgi:hypothetical protein
MNLLLDAGTAARVAHPAQPGVTPAPAHRGEPRPRAAEYRDTPDAPPQLAPVAPPDLPCRKPRTGADA